ncbi:MAG: prohibitin family protein [Candidatus Hydrothermales bacterium]
MIELIVVIIIIWLFLYLLYRFAFKIVLTEKSGEILPVRKIEITPFIILIFLSFFIAIYIILSFRQVPIGYTLITFNIFTKKYGLKSEGLQFVPRILYKTHLYNIRRQEYTMTARKGEGEKKDIDDSLWSPTKEGLQIGLDLTCWFRIPADNVIKIHKEIGPDYNEKVIRPAIRSEVRHTISSYSVTEIYSSRREEIQKEIEEKVKKRLEKDGFLIEAVFLRDVHFTPDFAKAIEEKQIAQQEAERMEYLLEKEKKEAERKKIEARGKAEAIRIISEELRKNPLYINYLFVDKLSDKVKVVISDKGTILNLQSLDEK